MYLVYAAVFLLTIILIDLAARFYYGRKALHLLENLPSFHVEKPLPQKQAVPFEFQSSGQVTLRGSIYYPDEMPPLGVILFCPETSSNHWSAVNYAQGLIDNGFIVVSFDFRNQGESDSTSGYQPMHWVSEYEVDDLRAAVGWIRNQEAFQDLPLGLLGISRGAATALTAMDSLSGIELIALDSGYTNDLLISHYMQRWVNVVVPSLLLKYYPRSQMRKTLDLAIAYSQYKRNCKYVITSDFFEGLRGKKILLIAGAKDSYVPLPITRELKKMLGESCSDLWVVPQASHNGARALQPQEYDRRLVSFFRQMVVQPAPSPVSGGVTASVVPVVQQSGGQTLATNMNEK